MTKSNGQADNRGSGNGSAATSREAGPDPANPQQFRPPPNSPDYGAAVGNAPIVEFIFNGQRLRAVVRDGEPWFFAADVCAELNLTNPRETLARLDDDERGVTITDTLGGPQTINVVNESGLYRLIFSSRKTGAQAFRRWVTAEVLPAIRRTGRYETDARRDCGVQVTLPHPGRYIATLLPDGHLDLLETGHMVSPDEGAARDAQMLAHAMKLVEGLWHEMQRIRSLGYSPEGSFALTGLDATIRAGARLASCLIQRKLNDEHEQRYLTH